MEKIKGEVVFRGKVVPVEVDINFNWLGAMGVVINLPESLIHENDIVHLLDFNFNLKEETRPLSEEDKNRYIKRTY